MASFLVVVLVNLLLIISKNVEITQSFRLQVIRSGTGGSWSRPFMSSIATDSSLFRNQDQPAQQRLLQSLDTLGSQLNELFQPVAKERVSFSLNARRFEEDEEEEETDLTSSSYTDEDSEFQENYRRVYNYSFDRTLNPNISMTVSLTIDKLASIISNPSYLQQYKLPGVYALLDAENAQPIFISSSEDMISSIFKRLKQINSLKKIAANQLNQVRKLSFNTNSDEEVYRKIQNLQIAAVKMEIFPKAKANVIEKVTSSLIKRIKPILNKLLIQYEAEINALTPPQQSTSKIQPTSAPTASPSSSPTPDGSKKSKEVVSPFQTCNTNTNKNKNASKKKGNNDDDDEEELELNKENVDKVLNEVRPYLMADGGNVEVVRVDAKEGLVELLLQGACGSCPSSTTTMKMGIERVLKENFESIQSVVAINLNESRVLTLDTIQNLIAKLLPTIEKLGGKAEIESVDGATGVVKVKYTGPEKLRRGIELIIRENDLVKGIEFI